VQRINNDAREDEMEDNMQMVGSVLGNLKNMAQDMGSEIERQNKQLDRIGNKVSVVASVDVVAFAINFGC
jgi:archaellum component FlaC